MALECKVKPGAELFMTGRKTVGSGNRWLNRTVLGIGLASLFSDLSHEIATSVLPAFLATMGVAAAWLGLIEGVSDGLSSFAKIWSGYYTDKLQRRKPIAVLGYVITALGTAAFGLASAAWHVLIARACAWLGRGVRTPVRKALLAAAVTPDTYGRAFGFERMMDTLGAIVGPALAVVLLGLVQHNYPRLFALTLVPGLVAAGLMAFVVQEKERRPVQRFGFMEGLHGLPRHFRTFLVAVGVFGAGDFAHSMLILLAGQRLAASLGQTGAATVAVSLYLFHNVLYAAFAFVAGWLADRLDKRLLLSCGYGIGAAMAVWIIVGPPTIWSLAITFAAGGIYVGIEEALEDSLCAELVGEERHGMAFGVLATVNGIGDFLSSAAVGALWTWAGPTIAFAYSAVMFVAGALLTLRIPAEYKITEAGS